ncbi:MAG: AI-2E family transporter [Planctomycetota bacterium]|jgi:predicted PurR-regulated permease PerM
MAKASNAPSNASAFLLGIIATILLGWLFKVGSAILQPLAIALLLASMLAPVVRFGARFRIPPMVSVLGMVSLLFVGIVQLIFLAQANLAVFLEQPAPIEVSVGQPAPALPEGPTAGAGTAGNSEDGEPTAATPAGSAAQGEEGDPPAEGEGLQSGAAGPEGTGAAESNAGEAAMVGDAEQAEENEGPRLDPVSSSQAERIAEAGGISRLIDNLSARLDRSALPSQLVAYLKKELAEFKAEDRATQLAQAFLGSGVNVFRTMLLVVIYMLFIFAEQAVFRRKILAVAGDRREDATRVLDTMARGLQQFLGIKTLISVATGAICYSMLVALQIPYALLWGILTFALNFIPYFGSLLAGLFATATALAVEPTVDKAVIVAVGYFTVNTVLGSIVEPKVMGRELDLSPLVILFSVVAWGTLWGLVGAFLAVPLTAAIQIVLASSDATRPIAVMLSSGPPRDSRRSTPRLPYKQAG